MFPNHPDDCIAYFSENKQNKQGKPVIRFVTFDSSASLIEIIQEIIDNGIKSVFPDAYIPPHWIGVQSVSSVCIVCHNLFLKYIKCEITFNTDISHQISLKNQSEKNMTLKEKMEMYFSTANLSI